MYCAPVKPRILALPVVSIAFAAALGCGAANPPPAPPPPVAPPPTASAAPVAVAEAPPKLRLPGDTRPTAEAIELHIDPKQDRFSGIVDIAVTLDQPRTVVWLHGKGLNVTRATATPDGGSELQGTWQQRDESGTASLSLPQALPQARRSIHVEFDAPYASQLEGPLQDHRRPARRTPSPSSRRSTRARRSLASTSRASRSRSTRPSSSPADAVAIANTHEIDRKTDGGSLRVHFAPTLPLPSYLVAFAVGPLDVVAAPDVPPNARPTRPLPLRGVDDQGARQGDRLCARAHRRDPLVAREVLRIEYPYDKLDIIAVPDKGGAMENAGAVTFGDDLLLFDEKTAPVPSGSDYARSWRTSSRTSGPATRHRRVVGRHLAQRGVRHLGREQDRRPVGPRR